MTSASLDEPGLARWGRVLGEAAARDRVFVALSGPLGAGKTRLAQAACAGAGVSEPVTSPTYTLVHWYKSDRGPVAHVDLYRIRDVTELPGLGWEQLESGFCPVFVEWADRAVGELPPNRWDISLEFGAKEGTRAVSVREVGEVPRAPQPPIEAAPEAASC